MGLLKSTLGSCWTVLMVVCLSPTVLWAQEPAKTAPPKKTPPARTPAPLEKKAPAPAEKKAPAPAPAAKKTPAPPAAKKEAPKPAAPATQTPAVPVKTLGVDKALRQGEVLYSQAQWAKALPVLLEAEKLGDKSPDLYFRIAWIYQGAEHNPALAEKYYGLALKANPKFLLAMTNLAELMRTQGKYAEALKWLDAALKINPTYPDALYNKGVTFDSMGKTAQAFAAYLQVLKLNPYATDAYNNAGIVLLRVGSLERASRFFSRCVKLQGDFAAGHFNLAIALTRRGQMTSALPHLEEAVGLDPANELYRLALVGVYLRMDRTDSALDLLLKGLTEKPNDLAMNVKLAELYLQEGKYGLAAAGFRKSIAIKPSAGLFYGLGLSEKRRRDYEAAYKAFAEAGRLGMSDRTGVLSSETAECLEYMGKPREAEKVYAVALKLRSRDVGLLNSAALNYLRLGKIKEAEALLADAIKIVPGAAGSYVNMGHLETIKGDNAQAAKHFQQGIERGRDDGFSAMWLYFARMRAGQSAQAQLGILAAAKVKWPRPWERELVAYCAGLKSQEELFDAADNDDKRCEASFYSAERLAVLGDAAKAKQYYEKCRALKINDYYEPWLAEWRLKALAQKKK